MATLNNPINAQNIVDRFSDYVVATANQGIIWGTNNVPVGDTSPAVVDPIVQIVPTDQFGGTTGGKAIGITGANIEGPGGLITASAIYQTLVNETNSYTNIRQLNAVLRVTGTGGNAGTRLTNSGYDGSRAYIEVTNTTNPAYLAPSYSQSISISPAAAYELTDGSIIKSSRLEQFFSDLQLAYNAARSTVVPYITEVCHASCHSSCHGSRGRR
jgi:hypothetical protein